jgi:hypothetical protein
MGFVKDAAKIGTFGLAGLALSDKNKKPIVGPQPMITMSNQQSQRPTSMIGSTRGMF